MDSEGLTCITRWSISSVSSTNAGGCRQRSAGGFPLLLQPWAPLSQLGWCLCTRPAGSHTNALWSPHLPPVAWKKWRKLRGNIDVHQENLQESQQISEQSLWKLIRDQQKKIVWMQVSAAITSFLASYNPHHSDKREINATDCVRKVALLDEQ